MIVAGTRYSLANVPDVSVEPHDAVLEVESATRAQPIERLLHGRTIIRMDQVQECLAGVRPLSGRDAMDGEHLVGKPVDPARGEVPLPMPHMGDRLRFAEKLLAPSQSRGVAEPPDPVPQVGGQLRQRRDGCGIEGPDLPRVDGESSDRLVAHDQGEGARGAQAPLTGRGSPRCEPGRAAEVVHHLDRAGSNGPARRAGAELVVAPADADPLHVQGDRLAGVSGRGLS